MYVLCYNVLCIASGVYDLNECCCLYRIDPCTVYVYFFVHHHPSFICLFDPVHPIQECISHITTLPVVDEVTNIALLALS